MTTKTTYMPNAMCDHPRNHPKHLAPAPIQDNINRWLADVATTFMTFSFIGAAWGCFNPIPVPGISSVVTPLRPFSSLASVWYCAATIGTVAAVQRFTSGGLTLARAREDRLNDLVGLGVTFGYTSTVLLSERLVIWNNRAVAGVLAGLVVYANIAP